MIVSELFGICFDRSFWDGVSLKIPRVKQLSNSIFISIKDASCRKAFQMRLPFLNMTTKKALSL